MLPSNACLLSLASRKLLHMLTTAEGVMTQTDRLNGDGLQEVFATNLFGHFILVRLHMKIEPLACLLMLVEMGPGSSDESVLSYRFGC